MGLSKNGIQMFREETVGYPRPWIATSIVVVQRALVALLGNQRLSARGRDGYRDARVAGGAPHDRAHRRWYQAYGPVGMLAKPDGSILKRCRAARIACSVNV